MRSKTARRFIIVTAILLAFGATTVISSAYFSDYETAAGQAGIHLSGQTQIEEKWQGTEKVVWIQNTGKVDVVVRAGVFAPEKISTITLETPGDWKQGEDKNFWYYQHVLKPGDSTSEIKVSVSVKDVDIDYRDFDIVVVQECAPVNSATGEVIDPNGTFTNGWEKGLIPSVKAE
ncbi:MAG: hypothetical protein IJV66_04045 [Firmicutes bacterium]|nr:hypothetical protein [Bacillota bacterium]